MGCPGPGSHAEWGVLVRGVMHSKVSWPGESCIVRYPDQGSHAKDPGSYMSWLLDTIRSSDTPDMEVKVFGANVYTTDHKS